VQLVSPDRRHASILIVDDDEGVTSSFSRLLRLEGYTVHTASNGEAGLHAAETTMPDAVILDLRMPLVDGLGLLRRLRANNLHNHVPVAIVTGDYFLSDEISAELSQLGAQLLYKPLWLEDLVGLARTLVAHRRNDRVTH
jgi:two-component system OmpR family response regulator